MPITSPALSVLTPYPPKIDRSRHPYALRCFRRDWLDDVERPDQPPHPRSGQSNFPQANGPGGVCQINSSFGKPGFWNESFSKAAQKAQQIRQIFRRHLGPDFVPALRKDLLQRGGPVVVQKVVALADAA